MIKPERVNFKCPWCDTIISGNSAEVAIMSHQHYKEVHELK